MSQRVELSGMVGYQLRGSPDEFDLSSGFRWGVGTGFPRRSPLRGLVELEVSGMLGSQWRGSPDEFDLSSGFRWGVGTGFPSRSPLRVLLELEGEVPTGDSVTVNNQI